MVFVVVAGQAIFKQSTRHLPGVASMRTPPYHCAQLLILGVQTPLSSCFLPNIRMPLPTCLVPGRRHGCTQETVLSERTRVRWQRTRSQSWSVASHPEVPGSPPACKTVACVVVVGCLATALLLVDRPLETEDSCQDSCTSSRLLSYRCGPVSDVLRRITLVGIYVFCR